MHAEPTLSEGDRKQCSPGMISLLVPQVDLCEAGQGQALEDPR